MTMTLVLAGKAVHFHQQLVQGLFPFVVSAADAGAAVAADCVNFIDKDNRRSVFLRLIEQVTDTGRTDTHKHFHEIRTGNGEERARRLLLQQLSPAESYRFREVP